MTGETTQTHPGVHLHIRGHADELDSSKGIIVISVFSRQDQDTRDKALTDDQFGQLHNALQELQAERGWPEMVSTADAPFKTFEALQVVAIHTEKPGESLDYVEEAVRAAIEAMGLPVTDIRVIPSA